MQRVSRVFRGYKITTVVRYKNEIGSTYWITFKIRHYTSQHFIITIYCSLFNLHLNHGFLLWGQNQETKFRKTRKLQQKAYKNNEISS